MFNVTGKTHVRTGKPFIKYKAVSQQNITVTTRLVVAVSFALHACVDLYINTDFSSCCFLLSMHGRLYSGLVYKQPIYLSRCGFILLSVHDQQSN